MKDPDECVLCKKSCSLTCERCENNYCSLECQLKDWPDHLCICLPRLVDKKTKSTNYNDPSTLSSKVTENDDCLEQTFKDQMLDDDTNSLATAVRRHTNPFLPTIPTSDFPINHINQLSSRLVVKKTKATNCKDPSILSSKVTESDDSLEQTFEEQMLDDDTNSVTTANRRHTNPFLPTIPTSDFPKNNTIVILTGFKSPNRCYVRSFESSQNDAFWEVSQLVHEFGKFAQPLTSSPNVGEFVITKHKDRFYRGDVLNQRRGGIFRILLIDYGHIVIRTLPNLKQITQRLFNLRCYVFPIALKDVECYEYSKKLVEYYSSFKNQEFRIVYFNDNTKLKQCVLYSHSLNENLNKKLKTYYDLQGKSDDFKKTKSNEDISQTTSRMTENNHETIPKTDDDETVGTDDTKTLKEMESSDLKKIESNEKPEETRTNKWSEENHKTEAKMGETEMAVKYGTKTLKEIGTPVLVPPFKTIRFVKGAGNFKVLLVDDSNIETGCFGCIPLSFLDIFEKITKYLSRYKDNYHPYKPQIDEYCLAKFKGDWYRAKVIDTTGSSHFQVVYIDFTNECIVDEKDVRRYPMDLDLPCCATLCLIDGLPFFTLDLNVIKYLKIRLGLYYEVGITKVIATKENVAIVRIGGLIEDLKSLL